MKASTTPLGVALQPGLSSIVSIAIATCALIAVIWGAQRYHTAAGSTCLNTSVHGCRFGSQAYFFEDGGTAFNEAPPEWRLRAFDSACQPRQLLATLFNASSSGDDSGGSAQQLVIAMYGDRCACANSTAHIRNFSPIAVTARIVCESSAMQLELSPLQVSNGLRMHTAML